MRKTLGPNQQWPEADIEVESDGRTVWVNAPCCLGRFCKVSAEVFAIPKDRHHCRDGYIECGALPSWSWWKRRMLTAHDLEIPEEFRPEYA